MVCQKFALIFEGNLWELVYMKINWAALPTHAMSHFVLSGKHKFQSENDLIWE